MSGATREDVPEWSRIVECTAILPGAGEEGDVFTRKNCVIERNEQGGPEMVKGAKACGRMGHPNVGERNLHLKTTTKPPQGARRAVSSNGAPGC